MELYNITQLLCVSYFDTSTMELVSVSAPIFDHNNKVVAAVTVPRFAESIDELGLMELGNQLMQLGKSISIRLGWTDNVSLRLNEVEC